MKTIFIFSLIFLTFKFNLIYCDITIIGPNELSSKFNNKPIEMTFNKIGKSSYNFYSRGELLLDPNNVNNEACQSFPHSPKFGDTFQESMKILLVKRGGCSFVQKARNAQRGGYSMVIIVNNIQANIKGIIMSDDGSGSDINIPIIMISQDDGTIIMNYLEKNKSSSVIIEVNFTSKKVDYKAIDVKIFFSSSELRAYELFNNLSQYIYKFGNQVNFIPIYVVHRSPFYDEESSIRVINCVSKGKYCYFPKETTITKDGQAIIMEDIRQKCLYDISKNDNNVNNYFNYINYFHSECLNKNSPKFNDNCSKNVLRSLGYSIRDIESCIANSYNVKDLMSNLYIDNDNKILKNEYDELLKYKLTTFPSVVINDKPLEGIIKESKIINEVCNLIRDKPDFCMVLGGIGNKKKFMIYILILLVILINVVIFAIFRKYIIERINERIVSGGLDLDSRIKNVIGNYFSLSKINNDYIKMKNNPTSSTDLQNQKGKVVDISVEMT